MSWLSGLPTDTAVRTVNCRGCKKFILSWLSGLYAVMVVRALHGHGSPSLILSRLSGLYVVMVDRLHTDTAITSSYCHG